MRIKGLLPDLHNLQVMSQPTSAHTPAPPAPPKGRARGSPGEPRRAAMWGFGWVLPPLSNSWIITIIWLYIALTRTPNIDCYWVGAVPKVLGFLKGLQGCR